MKTSRVVIIAVVAALLPMVLPTFYVNLGTQILIAAICASGLNVLVGYAGLIAIGHPVLLGVSAYVCTILMIHTGLGSVEAGGLAVVSVTVLAGLFAPLALRSSGLSFMMITMAFGQVLWGLAYRWIAVTGGDNGLTLPSHKTVQWLQEAVPFYYLSLACFLISIGAIAIFVSSRLGASLRGTKDQPRRMSALGYNVDRIRRFAFTFSAFWCAVAGVLFVHFFKYIHPQQLNLGSAAEYLLMVIVGGAGTLSGPIVGAAIVVIVRNAVSSYFDRWMMLLGFIFVAVVLFLPEGLVPGAVKAFRATRSGVWRSKPRGSLADQLIPQADSDPGKAQS